MPRNENKTQRRTAHLEAAPTQKFSQKNGEIHRFKHCKMWSASSQYHENYMYVNTIFSKLLTNDQHFTFYPSIAGITGHNQ